MSFKPPIDDDVDLTVRMSALPYESLVQGYERGLFEKAREAKSIIRATAILGLGLHGMAFAFFGLGLFLPFNSEKDSAVTISTLFWWGSALAAVIGGIMTLRRWSIVPWGWIVLGLTPWMLIATELMILGVLMSRIYRWFW